MNMNWKTITLYFLLSLSLVSIISFPIVYAQNPIVDFFRRFIFRSFSSCSDYSDQSSCVAAGCSWDSNAEYCIQSSFGGEGGGGGGLTYCKSDGVTVCGEYSSANQCTYPCTGSGGGTGGTSSGCSCDYNDIFGGSTCSADCGSKYGERCFDVSECVSGTGGGTGGQPTSCSSYYDEVSCLNSGCEWNLNQYCEQKTSGGGTGGTSTPPGGGSSICRNPYGSKPVDTCSNFASNECPKDAGCSGGWWWQDCSGSIADCSYLTDENSCKKAGCFWGICSGASLSFDKSVYLPDDEVKPSVSSPASCQISSFEIRMSSCSGRQESTCSSTSCTTFKAPTTTTTYVLCDAGTQIASSTLTISSLCGNKKIDPGEECDSPGQIITQCASGGYQYCFSCKLSSCTYTAPSECEVGGFTPSVSPTSIKQGDTVTVGVSNIPSGCKSYQIFFQQSDQPQKTSDYGGWRGTLAVNSFSRSGLTFPSIWGQGTFFVWVWLDNGDGAPGFYEFTRKAIVSVGSIGKPASCSIDPPSVKQSVSSGTLRQPFVVTFVNSPPVRDVEVLCASPYGSIPAVPLDQSTGKATFTCIYVAVPGKSTVIARAGGVQCTASVEITPPTVTNLKTINVRVGVFRSQIPETEGCTSQIYLAKGQDVLSKTVITTSDYIEYSPISDGVVKVTAFCLEPTVSIYKSFVTVSKSSISSPSLSCSKSENSITCNWSNCQISSDGLNEIAVATPPNFLESKKITQDTGSETFENLASGSYTALLTCENGDLFQQVSV